MARRLIDTSVLVTFDRRKSVIADLKRVVGGDDFSISSITAAELLTGVYRTSQPSARARRERFVESVLTGLPIIPFDLPVARVHAELWADLESRGLRIGALDLQIAATALAHDMMMVTENRREFDRVPNLIVESPVWDADG